MYLNVLYYYQSRGLLVFYDKIKEQQAKNQLIPELYQNRNVLRYEQRHNDVFVALGGFISNPTMDDLKDVMTDGKATKKRFQESVAETLAAIKIPSLRAEQVTPLSFYLFWRSKK